MSAATSPIQGEIPKPSSEAIRQPSDAAPVSTNPPLRAEDSNGVVDRMLWIAGIVLLIVGVFLVWQIGFAETLVVAEVFVVFGGWFAVRVRNVIGHSSVAAANRFSDITMVLAGLIAGTLAAFLILTTEQGYALVMWITDNTVRTVGSLFVAIFAAFGLDALLQAVIEALRGKH